MKYMITFEDSPAVTHDVQHMEIDERGSLLLYSSGMSYPHYAYAAGVWKRAELTK